MWFGYVRVYGNPDESVAHKRVILREEPHLVNVPAAIPLPSVLDLGIKPPMLSPILVS